MNKWGHSSVQNHADILVLHAVLHGILLKINIDAIKKFVCVDFNDALRKESNMSDEQELFY